MKHGENGIPEGNFKEGAGCILETEVTPQLPTSGQILGELVKSLGIDHPKLQSKTARRYFSGRLDDRISESSRTEIISAIAETLVEQGVGTSTSGGDDTSSTLQALATILDSLAVKWDRFRAFLRPRTMSVFPSHLPDIRRSYARLASIDLALRIAAQMRLSGAHPTSLDFLDWVEIDRRGKYLDKLRTETGIPSRFKFSEDVHVDVNTVDEWVDHGSRPLGKNLRNIAKALTKDGNSDKRAQVLRELRRLYWASDLAVALGEYIGSDSVAEIVEHLKLYAALVYDSIEDHIEYEARPSALADLLSLGAESRISEPLLRALASTEINNEWREDPAGGGIELDKEGNRCKLSDSSGRSRCPDSGNRRWTSQGLGCKQT